MADYESFHIHHKAQSINLSSQTCLDWPNFCFNLMHIFSAKNTTLACINCYLIWMHELNKLWKLTHLYTPVSIVCVSANLMSVVVCKVNQSRRFLFRVIFWVIKLERRLSPKRQNGINGAEQMYLRVGDSLLVQPVHNDWTRMKWLPWLCWMTILTNTVHGNQIVPLTYCSWTEASRSNCRCY